MTIARPLTRRTIVAVALLLLVGACGDDDAPAAGASGERGPWSFELGDGTEISLDEQPERIVMFEDVAASLMDLGVRPVGIHYINGENGNRIFEGVDLDGIEPVGTGCEQVNIEAVAELRPDLLVYMSYGEERFCLTSDQVEQLEGIAPILAIDAERPADDVRASYLDLAERLGADLDSAAIAAKRARFEAASQRLQAAVAARPDISVVPVAIAPDYVGVAEPAAFADLVELRDRYGVTFAGPFAPDAESTGTYFEELSAERIADHRGDVILIDSKNETSFEARRAAYPLWARLPEVEAEQFVEWFVPGSFSYSRDADAMERLAAAIESAEDLVTEGG